MPIFEYTAINEKGKSTKGTIDSENLRSARQKLRSKGIYPTNINEVGEVTQDKAKDIKRYFNANKISSKELPIITRQLATLVGAGLPLVSSLQALSDQTETTASRRIIIDIKEDVEQGSSLAKALARSPKSFPRLFINMVTAGEASGTLDTVLSNLADYLESQAELKRKVRSALLYPILMLIICTLVITALLIFVVPKIVEIFQKNGATLPLPTQILLLISSFLVSYWHFLIVFIIGLALIFRWYADKPNGRSNIHWLLLKLPIFSPIYIKVATARFSRTLSTLLSSGVGLLPALEIVENIISNVHMSKIVSDAREGVREGKSLAKEISKGALFPILLSHMMAIGEKSGELETMLAKASRSYETEVSSTLSGLTSLLEPLLMLVVGGIVLVIVLAILLPMADLINVVQGGR